MQSETVPSNKQHLGNMIMTEFLHIDLITSQTIRAGWPQLFVYFSKIKKKGVWLIFLCMKQK